MSGIRNLIFGLELKGKGIKMKKNLVAIYGKLVPLEVGHPSVLSGWLCKPEIHVDTGWEAE